jgi:hypothetical protein
VVNGRIDVGAFEVQTNIAAINLRVSRHKVGGINTVHLTWTGATSNSMDLQRDGMVIATVPNTGTYADSTGDTGRARYRAKCIVLSRFSALSSVFLLSLKLHLRL